MRFRGFKFGLGDIVSLDPTGEGVDIYGLVIARIEDIDGGASYFVSVQDRERCGIHRHYVLEVEIRSTDQSDDDEIPF